MPIFTPDFTLKPKGTGCGLPMARDVVWEHGGEISIVESEVGQGTTFYLRFAIRVISSHDKGNRLWLPVDEEGRNISCLYCCAA